MRIPSGSTDRKIYFVGVDVTDLKTRETGLSSFTVVYSLDGAADVTYTTPTVAEIDAVTMPGVYALTVDEGTTLAAGHDTEEYCLHITQASMAPVTRVLEIYRVKFTEGQSATMANSAVDADLERVAGATTDVAALATNVAAILVDTGTTLQAEVDGIQADTEDIQARLPAALVGGRIDASVGAMAAGVVTAAAVATGAIDADALAADASAEIADAVWDEDATGHQTQGTFGQAIGDPAADTNTIFKAVVTDAAGATIGADIVDIEGKVDDLEGRLIGTIAAGTHEPQSGDSFARLGVPAGASVSADIAAIEAQTDDIGVAGAGLTALGDSRIANLDATISSRAAPGAAMDLVADAIDGTAVAASGVDEIWDEAVDGATTARQALRLANSANGGKVSGAETTTVVIRDLADSKDRVTATVDEDGNRTAVTLDLT